MAKINRELIYRKYGGKCAYCGDPVEFKKMQVDHIVSQYSHANHRKEEDPHRESNLNPSCARCNKWKSTFSVEQFRFEIAEQISRMNKRVPGYRIAKSFGLLTETKQEVKFYFENYNHDH